MASRVSAAFLIVRLLLGAARAASLLRRATPQPGFLASAECACPITVGWRRPVVVLPASWKDWPAAELDAVLAHEREHARRRDPLVQWFAALNRCVFWFHPLAWWLEFRLSALAEEACDSAALARGHDPREYSQYLLHQAAAIHRAGARIALPGAAMGRGSLENRIRRLLETPLACTVGRGRTAMAHALCAAAIVAFGACRLDRAERAAPGQPTENQLMHRRAAAGLERQQHEKALVEHAHALNPADAQALLARLKQNPQDQDAYWTLVRHYEFRSDVKGLDGLRLWYIEHQPDSKIWPGNINPRYDRSAYERGKSLWLANLKRPGATADRYQRAADFLEGGDKPLAESVLEAGRKAYPDDARWSSCLGRHYAQVLLGSTEPVTEFNVFRSASAQESQSPYAQTVRARLADSTDVRVLAQTAQYLLAWDRRGTGDALPLARAYVERALTLDPHSELAREIHYRVAATAEDHRKGELVKMSPAEQANLGVTDRMLLAITKVRDFRLLHSPEQPARARELLSLALQHPDDPAAGDALFEANMFLGKEALWRGDKRAAVSHLLAAAGTRGSERIRRGYFEMNLPRALVDWGERSAVADFLDHMAPKVARAQEFRDWSAAIRKGINPDMTPTFSYPGCTKDPC